MFCCFPFLRKSHSPPTPPSPINEKSHVIKFEPTRITYGTFFSIPYGHVLRDDKILNESSTINEMKNPSSYLLFDNMISEEEDETAFFSFDADADAPIVLTTRTTTAHILLERVFKIEHVTAINPSANVRMHPLSSNTIAMARPFDEFASDSNTSNNPSDLPNNDTTKSN